MKYDHLLKFNMCKNPVNYSKTTINISNRTISSIDRHLYCVANNPLKFANLTILSTLINGLLFSFQPDPLRIAFMDFPKFVR